MTKKKPKEKRVEEIVKAFVEEFLDKGYDRTSMEAVAQRAGISKGGLYFHFKSKEQILLQANVQLNSPVNEMMEEARRKSRASEGLAWYIKSYLEYWQEHRKEIIFLIMSMTKMLDSPEYMRMYKNYINKYIAFFKSLYQQGIASGEFLPHSVDDNAVTLMAALDGIVSYLLFSEDIQLDSVISNFQNRFIYLFFAKNQKGQNRSKNI